MARAPAPAPARATRGEDLSVLRYGQCWEDADVLVDALDVRAGDTCLSIGSGGDNTLALLTRDPERVIGIDISPAQIASLELRVAAYRELDHGGLLELVGSRPSRRRDDLYRRCRGLLSGSARRFWDGNPAGIASGLGAAGRFERYLALWRRRVLPLVHRHRTVERLLEPKPREERGDFYARTWDTLTWRLMFRAFFSRPVMGQLGRDPRTFRYVRGPVASRFLARTRYALTELDPSANPYVQWILLGEHRSALPLALRPESFEAVRSRLDRLEWHHVSLEEWVGRGSQPVDHFNLSDVFEYVSPEAYERVLERLVARARPGARLAYWNLLVRRSRPNRMAGRLRPLHDLAAELHLRAGTFFYGAFVLEEVL